MRFVNKLRAYFLILFLTLVFLIAGSFWYSIGIINENSIRILKMQTKTAYEKDLEYRHWSAVHGGVYAKVDSTTPPNPYLADIKERDLTTPSGIELTLVNPAYMSRQVFDMENRETGNFSHITSLNPIRKENAPDQWETRALKSFQKGVPEYSSLDTLNGMEYFRYMQPLLVEQSCLQCHAKQGYKVGDIRGGISVAVDITDTEKLKHSEIRNSIFVHGLFFIAGLTGLMLAFVSINSKEKKQKAIQFELEKSNEKLTLVNNQKDLFFSIIAHDLKNPFVSILGYGEILETEFKELSENEKLFYISEMRRSAYLSHELLHNLLQWSRSETGYIAFSPGETNLREIIDENYNLLNNTAGKKQIKLVNNVGDRVTVYADEDMLNTIFRNLISNAIKFCNKDDEITINADMKTEYVEISVSDTGVGIDKETLDRLFKIEKVKSQKGTNNERGTGLGLILCKEFLAKHNGSIRVESTPGKGTTFFFTLPNKKRETV